MVPVFATCAILLIIVQGCTTHGWEMIALGKFHIQQEILFIGLGSEKRTVHYFVVYFLQFGGGKPSYRRKYDHLLSTAKTSVVFCITFCTYP